ncbi:MAG TPA: hypothetical protein VFK86_04410 [Bauldia sp.]|nr:hypothetical protein [Bauldia sp.]
MTTQNLPAEIGSKMNALGYSADFIDATTEAWKKLGKTGYVTISAHDTDPTPLFPNNCLHANTSAKVWSVRCCTPSHALKQERHGLSLNEAVAQGVAYESA